MWFELVYRFVRTYAPTNQLMRWLRSRHGVLCSAPATLLLGLLYLWAAACCIVLLDQGAPGWLHLLVALFVWNGVKFLVAGPVFLAVLGIAWARRANGRGSASEVSATESVQQIVWVTTSSNPQSGCSGRHDHNPRPQCFVNGRCMAALGVIQSSR